MFEFLNGIKTYLAGGAMMATGLVKMADAVWPLVSGGGSVDGAALQEGWTMFMGGLAVFGIGHKLAKGPTPISMKGVK
jgi:hypothetical protein